ncbi:MAG: YebC/PmpR family DNA-binding transcriptional regulator [Dissulfurimicrobium sp.]|uniref:YebC/PmpR family DNA-binding transcriptional regulator n=1 Tax=Dissulfurimicrobium TaxID=1769732 RepID=UPI001EDBD90A|nr:YebC/PmpR family DNA-binding transcriptional regulator [Dissulfurimicrobium hydrothermale]UKL12985.1 YebC/PmpR family DNA-binding transcriptional regulator [Dissulfurimicrobium hydrothermale]
MSGHSKWSTIKHKKGALDAKRGKIFTKLIKEIMVAARLGGGDPASNPRLRNAIMAAKSENMPKENIERAIKKGTGELEGANYEEILYEGYGPGGVAVLVEAMTDNRQRTVSDVRHIFSKRGGSLGEPGSVAWMFEKKGLIIVEKSSIDEESLMTLALEAGAEDLKENESDWEIRTTPDSFEAVRAAIEAKGIKIEEAQVTMVPKTVVKIEDEQQAGQILRLMEAIEDNDDVQHVYANFDISDSLLEKLG